MGLSAQVGRVGQSKAGGSGSKTCGLVVERGAFVSPRNWRVRRLSTLSDDQERRDTLISGTQDLKKVQLSRYSLTL